MTYLDGTEILVGDSVLIEDQRTPGTIVDVVGVDRIEELGVDESGVMIASAPFGLLYIPMSMFADECLIFEARGESNYRWSGRANSSD
jgi:hypothetical protein